MPRQSNVALYAGPRSMMTEEVGRFLLARDVPIATVTDKDIHNGLLSNYPAIVIPGGWGPVMSSRAEANLKKYIAAGGGYVSLCAGTTYTHRLGLLDFQILDVRAISWCYICLRARHPVTKGYRLTDPNKRPRREGANHVRIAFSNGNFMIPGKGVTKIATFDTEGTLAAIIAGSYGKGRVVCFSPLPEQAVQPPPSWEWGAWQEPGGLFVNAINFAAHRTPPRERKR